jgi:hypothetical protein
VGGGWSEGDRFLFALFWGGGLRGFFGYAGAISPCALGLIEGGVSARDEVLRGGAASGGGGDSDADADSGGEGGRVPQDLVFCELLAEGLEETIGEESGLLGVGIREQDDELISAHAAGGVGGVDAGLE